jgi:3-oxoacyl-[acyl-carrier-protein] synthase II
MAALGPVPTPPSCDPVEFARQEQLEQLSFWCAEQALRDAGWWEQRSDPRLGVVIGLGAEWTRCWEMSRASGQNRVGNCSTDQDYHLGNLLRTLHITGPALNVAAACASGNIALGLARHWVQSGLVDACLTGACDRSVTPMSMAAFSNLGALTSRNDNPTAASRPFDRGRDGFAMGEGGALFVIEPAVPARRRGARCYAEFIGCGATSDAHHMVTPSADSRQAATAIRHSLDDAGINADEIDYVNAHATSTLLGDVSEARALRDVLGESAHTIPVSATKSMTGHLLSSTAAVEAVACLIAIDRQAIPPTINLDDPDPECNLCHVANVAQERRVHVAISNSFGFGGSNACVVFRKSA